jgi:predicted signal transduction protein with EAL and GGDEF domain
VDNPELRFARARRMARFASWEWSLETDEFHCDPELMRILDCNRAPPDQQIAELLRRVHPQDLSRVRSVWDARRPHQLEYRICVDGGRPRIVQQEAELVQDEANGEVRLLGVVQDITSLKEAEKRVSKLAYFDGLTGLPNRAFLREHLLRVMASAKRHNNVVALMAIDLDLFKRINDTLGHAAGDILLKEVGARINRIVRSGDAVANTGSGTLDLVQFSTEANTVARIGGDEFVVILDHLRAAEDAALVARRILDALSVGVSVSGTEVFIGCSIGIALFPDNGITADVLFKHADAAMYAAKDNGRNGFRFFEDSMNELAQRRLTLEVGMRAALANEEFKLYYQPKVDLETGKTIGVEALLRWPTAKGMVSPAEFIPVAEDTGIIVPLGEWVLRAACKQAKAWADAGRELPVAVNVSGRQFRAIDIAELISRVLAETGLPARLLEVEITEGVIMQDSTAGIEALRRVKALGVGIALDDFGTGYSSLSYLSRFPIDTLKIDRSFVKELGTTARSNGIAAAIIALAKTLSLKVVAEGVEGSAQAAFLLENGCKVCQGFGFSPAVPADKVADAYARI